MPARSEPMQDSKGSAERSASAASDRRSSVSEQASVEDLLQHADWIRGIARELLDDKSLAEDVVQEVWRAALQSPLRKSRAAPAWLSKVVRSIVYRENRRLRQRPKREETHESLRQQQITLPDEALARFETERELLDAVSALSERYRTVVYLRYFKELEIPDVATRLSVPESTVRTRLSRALEQLRARLTRRYGSRGGWCAALVPLLPRGEVEAIAAAWAREASLANGSADAVASECSSPTLRPARPASASKVMMTAGFALISVALVGWVAVRSHEHTGVSDSASRTAADRATDEVDASFLARTNATPIASVTPEAETTATPSTRSRLRVTDSRTGEGIVGAEVFRVQITRADGIPIGQTGIDGILSVQGADLRRDSLGVIAAGYIEYREPATLRDVATGLYEIELEPQFTASVVVTWPSR